MIHDSEKFSVIHIFNTAGVASILAKWQKRLYGWRTWVITRSIFDVFHLTTYGKAVNLRATPFKYYSLLMAFKFKLVHIHSADIFLPSFRRLYGRRKALVIHYHGSEIRGKWDARSKYWSIADIIMVSTPDLLEGAPSRAIYLPNPVDTLMFRPKPKLRRKNTALYIIKHQEGEDLEWPKKIAERMNLKLTMLDRKKTPIPYLMLPDFLNKFEYYIDRNYIPSLSKTALEALACGLKVIRWDEKIISGLPEEHKPENVISRLCEIYSVASDHLRIKC